MAQLCLTGKQGTLVHGLYRGLRIKTENTSYRVEAGVTELKHLLTDIKLPAIISVRLDEEVSRYEPRYSNQWGWKVGVNHSVVLLGFTDDNQIEVADPSAGREYWNIQSLKDLWHGVYITILS